MQIKVFMIPAFDSKIANEEMNKFLRSHQVIEVKQEFVPATNGAYWCFSVSYVEGGTASSQNRKEKKDYRKLLDKETFGLFEKLRGYRKIIAQEDAVPAYAVFTDAELVEIAKLDKIEEKHIKSIQGIGEKKTEKYGKWIAEMYNKDEKDRKSDT